MSIWISVYQLNTSIACYAVLMRPNKVETAVYGCKCWLQFELYHVTAPLSFYGSPTHDCLFIFLPKLVPSPGGFHTCIVSTKSNSALSLVDIHKGKYCAPKTSLVCESQAVLDSNVLDKMLSANVSKPTGRMLPPVLGASCF